MTQCVVLELSQFTWQLLTKHRYDPEVAQEMKQFKLTGAPHDISEEESATSNAVETTEKFDSLGFVIKNDDTTPVKVKEKMSLTAKWIKMLEKWKKKPNKEPKKLRKRLFKGIPDNIRPQAWRYLVGVVSTPRSGEYTALLAKPAKTSVTYQIDLDVNRAQRNHIQFKQRYGQGYATSTSHLLTSAKSPYLIF